MTGPKFRQEDYQAFVRYLEDSCGLMLGNDKDYLVASRLNRLLANRSIDSLRELIDRASAQTGAALREQIIDAMTTNETMWFRDGYPFDALARVILPELAATRPKQLRIWSAACSTGEEAYSIAMTVREFQAAKPLRLPPEIQIMATDISPAVLAQANSAIYEEKSLMRGVSAERRERFFLHREGGGWELRPEVRQLVSFRTLNLKDSYALLGKFDIIFCRNVLIYFSADLKRDIVTRMAQSLNPRSYLVMGAAESPNSYCDRFAMRRCRPGVVYQLK